MLGDVSVICLATKVTLYLWPAFIQRLWCFTLPSPRIALSIKWCKVFLLKYDILNLLSSLLDWFIVKICWFLRGTSSIKISDDFVFRIINCSTSNSLIEFLFLFVVWENQFVPRYKFKLSWVCNSYLWVNAQGRPNYAKKTEPE